MKKVLLSITLLLFMTVKTQKKELIEKFEDCKCNNCMSCGCYKQYSTCYKCNDDFYVYGEINELIEYVNLDGQPDSTLYKCKEKDIPNCIRYGYGGCHVCKKGFYPPVGLDKTEPIKSCLQMEEICSKFNKVATIGKNAYYRCQEIDNTTKTNNNVIVINMPMHENAMFFKIKKSKDLCQEVTFTSKSTRIYIAGGKAVKELLNLGLRYSYSFSDPFNMEFSKNTYLIDTNMGRIKFPENKLNDEINNFRYLAISTQTTYPIDIELRFNEIECSEDKEEKFEDLRSSYFLHCFLIMIAISLVLSIIFNLVKKYCCHKKIQELATEEKLVGAAVKIGQTSSTSLIMPHVIL